MHGSILIFVELKIWYAYLLCKKPGIANLKSVLIFVTIIPGESLFIIYVGALFSYILFFWFITYLEVFLYNEDWNGKSHQ